MTASDLRKTLRRLHSGGMVWTEIAHQINVFAGSRMVTMDTIRRFAVEERDTHRTTLYWVERWLTSRGAGSSATSR